MPHHPPADAIGAAAPSARVDERYLRAYVSDHLALSSGIASLAARMRDAKRWREQRTLLHDVAAAMEQDAADLALVLADRDIDPDRVKPTLARIGERFGRLKGNGRLLRSSPLTRLVEVEGLQLGMSGCAGAWVTLRDLGVDPERAERALTRLGEHRERLQRLRADVAPASFAD